MNILAFFNTTTSFIIYSALSAKFRKLFTQLFLPRSVSERIYKVGFSAKHFAHSENFRIERPLQFSQYHILHELYKLNGNSPENVKVTCLKTLLFFQLQYFVGLRIFFSRFWVKYFIYSHLKKNRWRSKNMFILPNKEMPIPEVKRCRWTNHFNTLWKLPENWDQRRHKTWFQHRLLWYFPKKYWFCTHYPTISFLISFHNKGQLVHLIHSWTSFLNTSTIFFRIIHNFRTLSCQIFL